MTRRRQLRCPATGRYLPDLRPQPRRWDEAEKRLLIEWWWRSWLGHSTARQAAMRVARKLGRTVSSVRNQATYLQLPRLRRYPLRRSPSR